MVGYPFRRDQTRMTDNFFDIAAANFPTDADSLFIERESGRRYSYRDLMEISGRYARLLTDLGVAKGDRVAVQVEKSAEAVFLYLACLRAGAAYLPLNTAYTKAEVGYFLTRGDTRTYKGGAFDRISPKNPVGSGGIGAVQVNLRYDYLDLNDAGIAGGTQNGLGGSIVWTPTAYTRLMANYGRMTYSDAFMPAAGGDRDYMKAPDYLMPVGAPPFYAGTIKFYMLALTSVGPRIDDEASVLHETGRVIPGLYAAGECAGGVLGSVYVGSGNSLANCTTYGRIAGNSAAAYARRNA